MTTVYIVTRPSVEYDDSHYFTTDGVEILAVFASRPDAEVYAERYSGPLGTPREWQDDGDNIVTCQVEEHGVR